MHTIYSHRTQSINKNVTSNTSEFMNNVLYHRAVIAAGFSNLYSLNHHQTNVLPNVGLALHENIQRTLLYNISTKKISNLRSGDSLSRRLIESCAIFFDFSVLPFSLPLSLSLFVSINLMQSKR